MTDTELLDALDEMVKHGCCPALVNDDFGNWTVLFDGMQPAVAAPGHDGWDTVFVSSKDQKWFTSPREAIQHAYKEWKP